MSSAFTYRPVRYFILTFFITYALWLTGGYVSFQDGRGGLYMAFMLPGLLAPFIISAFMIFASKNRRLKKNFINRMINIKLIRIQTLPVFLFLMPVTVIVSINISLLFGGSLDQFQFAEGFSFSMGSVPILIVLILAAAFEELGWRGYAFDSLQSKYTFFTATLIFSILWSAWHLPLLFVNGSYQREILDENIWFAINFFVSIIPMGIIISWVCIKNRKSVIAAILFHFIINISQEVLSMTQITKSIETGVLAIVAIGIILWDKDLFFSKSPTQI